MSVAAILLAAGASQRLGQPKQLLMYEGETLLERAMRLAAEGGADPVLVVLGAAFAPICAAVSFGPAIPIYNERWDFGLSTSIRAGMREVAVRAPEAEGVLLMACDQPRLSAKHLRKLLAKFQKQSRPSIVASSYADIQGTPMILPRATFPLLRALRGDKGARAVLEQSPCPVVSVPFAGGEVDIDAPRDLAYLA